MREVSKDFLWPFVAFNETSCTLKSTWKLLSLFLFLYLDAAAARLLGGRCSKQSQPERNSAAVSWEPPVTTIKKKEEKET